MIRRLNRALAERILDPLGTAEGNPEQETQTLNSTKDAKVLKYYSGCIISGVDKITALLVEKAMVAQYIITERELPPQQGLPNFGARKGAIEDAVLIAKDFISHLNTVFK